jgi:hypothetical protein
LQKEIQQTLRNRENFQSEVVKYDSMIAEELEEKRKELQEMHNSALLEKPESFYDKPKKNGHSEEDQYLEAYKQLAKYITLDDEQYLTDPKFLKLIDGLDRKREYETVINERKMQLEELQKKYEEQKRELETLSKAKEDGEDLASGDPSEEEEHALITED